MKSSKNRAKNILKRAQDIKFGKDLIDKSRNLSEYIKSIEYNYRDREDFDINFPFEDVHAMLNCVAWSYPISSEEIITTDVDRMAPMLIGPLFTSDSHPWPMKGGKFLEPLIQFDLEWAGGLSGVNLGEGILQLWLDSLSGRDDHEIRIIPKQDFLSELLSPAPEKISMSYFQDSLFFAGEMYGWLDKENEGASVIMTETGAPTLTWHRRLRDALVDLAYNMGGEGAARITTFLDFLPAESPSPTPHFFGICAPVQYDAAELPSCLLALDSQGPYIWGDSGNAQIFYSPSKDGAVRFSFAWSCH